MGKYRSALYFLLCYGQCSLILRKALWSFFKTAFQHCQPWPIPRRIPHAVTDQIHITMSTCPTVFLREIPRYGIAEADNQHIFTAFDTHCEMTHQKISTSLAPVGLRAPVSQPPHLATWKQPGSYQKMLATEHVFIYFHKENTMGISPLQLFQTYQGRETLLCCNHSTVYYLIQEERQCSVKWFSSQSLASTGLSLNPDSAWNQFLAGRSEQVP